MQKKNFLKTHKQEIHYKDAPVRLRGVNLGGWLMKEAYFMHAPNFPEQFMRKEFIKKLGQAAWDDYEKSFQKTFVQESDIENLSRIGANFIRLPIHHKLLEPKAYEYDEYGLKFLDKVIQWCKKYRIWILLDLHGAQGSQNHDWHSDSDTRARLWTSRTFQKRVFAWWEMVADRYKNEEIVAGYDLLNEPIVHDGMWRINKFYNELIKHIRKVDQNHILFVEGNTWATIFDGLEIEDDNYLFSIHSYEPLDFTFNFVPLLNYPMEHYNQDTVYKHHQQFLDLSNRKQVPIHVGEFGVNYRQGIFGEDMWLKDTLKCFNEFGFHWTYWTYKAIKNYAFPDGLYSYYPNVPWVNRPGPRQGWETHHLHWKDKRTDMINSWKTEQFTENTKVVKQIKDAVKDNQKPD